MTDEELIARLRDFDPHLHEWEVVDEAADRIEQLVKEAKAAEKEIANLRENYDAVFARAERLEAAVAILEDALQEAGDDYPGSSMQQWCQHQVKAARAALKGDDHE